MIDNEVLYPQVIDAPLLPTFLGELISSSDDSSSNEKGDVATPKTTATKKLPVNYVAPQTISESINTKTKQILGQYTFGQVGAIAIGAYEFGISGDIRISPDGITARNVNGETTFSIDSATGDAIFKGTVQAADFTVVDELGIVSLAAFQTGTGDFTDAASTYLTRTATSFGSWTDVDADLSVDLELMRAGNVYVFFSCASQIAEYTHGPPFLAEFRILIDSSQVGAVAVVDGTQFSSGTSNVVSIDISRVLELAAGTHTLKIQWRAANGTVGMMGTTELGLSSGEIAAQLGFITFGR